MLGPENCMGSAPLEDMEEESLKEAKDKMRDEIVSEGFEKVEIFGSEEPIDLYVIRLKSPYKCTGIDGKEEVRYMADAMIGFNEEQARRYASHTALTREANHCGIGDDGTIKPFMSLRSLREEQENFEREKAKQDEIDRKQSNAAERFVK
ncbi:MAG TPA: hypothetical protein PLA19_01085 [Candidatus Pacearchaeota archaeon]|nr:hypothetical protein [Candidatus Pacearchaeota archaeon]